MDGHAFLLGGAMILDPLLDLFRGHAVTIPPLDGAFRPDTRLDDAPDAIALAEADNLVALPSGPVASSGAGLYRIARGRAVPWRTLEAPITAAAVSPEGELTVALATGGLIIGDRVEPPVPERGCITALAYDQTGALWLANGSAERPPSRWAEDLMRHGATGSLWRRGPGETRFERVAADLAWPGGVLPQPGATIVSESWRHRLLRVGAGGREVILDKLPGYPGRLSPAPGGGAWLCLFAPRNRLIELVLEERHFRLDMIATVAPEYWIAPRLSASRSFLEPLQCGAIKTMGVHKPWAPSLSYGLVARLDTAMQPVESLHSRANGHRHGVCSALEHEGRLLVAARGGGVILDLAPGAAGAGGAS